MAVQSTVRTNRDLASGLREHWAEKGSGNMRTLQPKPFVCAQCGTDMERMQSVAVLESLVGHAVYCCEGCGHVLLVQEARAPEWSGGWLSPLFMDGRPAITYVGLV